MYSRYTPNPSGGFDRRVVPDPPLLPPQSDVAAHSVRHESPAQTRDQGSRIRDQGMAECGMQDAECKMRFPAEDPGPHSRDQKPFSPPAPPRPGGPGPPAPPPMAPPFPFSLLGNLFPRGLDAEELLVLAVLLLAMKQDGATGMELLIAAGIYLWFQ